MNNRPKISSLSEKELAQLLIDSFFKVGKELKLSISETKIFLDEVYKKQGWMFVDTFSEVFSMFAAGEIPDCEKMHVHTSPLFIGRLMKLYLKKSKENRFTDKSEKNKSSVLTPEGKYKLFIQFILANSCLPVNPDWVGIYEHLTEIKKMYLPDAWETLTYHAKWKYAASAVSDWAYAHFTINDILIYKTTGASGNIKGIGTRLGETLR